MASPTRLSHPSRRDVLGLAAAAGLLPFATSAAPAQRMVMVAKPTDIRSLDPCFDTSDVGQGMFKSIFDQLTMIGGDGSVLPGLAESWQANADATEWAFKIRGNSLFHDGKPVTAEDVVFTYQHLMDDPATAPRAYVSPIASIAAPDANTVTFKLKAPFAPFDRQVSLISILPKHAYPLANPTPFAIAPIGSGPYRVVEWVKDDRLVLRAHDGYWGGAPAVKDVSVRPIPTEQARVAGLRSGELDIVPSLPPVALPMLTSDPSVAVSTVPSIRVIYMAFNMKNPILSDIRIRRAIDMCIDRNTIATRLLRGLGKPEGQLVGPVTFGYDPAIKPTAFDPDAARQLVKDSGYDGTPVLFQYPSNRWPFASEVAQGISGYLQKIGIKTDMQAMEYNALFSLWAVQNLPGIHIFGYGPSVMDASLVFSSLVNTRTTWNDPLSKRLYVEQLATSDPVVRKQKISELSLRIRDQVPYSVLYNEYQAYGVRKGINFKPRADETILCDSISFA